MPMVNRRASSCSAPDIGFIEIFKMTSVHFMLFYLYMFMHLETVCCKVMMEWEKPYVEKCAEELKVTPVPWLFF